MISSALDIPLLVTRLLELLDEQIPLLELRIAQLKRLSDSLMDRDEKKTGSVLEEMEQALARQERLDLKLQAARRLLADALALPVQQVRLSLLSAQLEGQQRTEVELRRQEIVLLSEQLKRQHMETCFFLYESARINQMLLESLLPQSGQVVTYGSSGAQNWRDQSGLLNTEI